MLSGVVVFGPRAPFCENRELNADGESESAVLKHRIPNLERQSRRLPRTRKLFHAQNINSAEATGNEMNFHMDLILDHVALARDGCSRRIERPRDFSCETYC